MFAAQRSHENVKLREAVEKTLLGSIFRCQDVEKGRGPIIEEELAGTETEIQIRMRIDLASYNLFCGSGRHQQILSGFIDENLAPQVERQEAEG